MHINDLPEDILIIIIQQYACHTSIYDFERLKKSLPLLATCRLWRIITMPFIFDRVKLDYSNKGVLRKRFAEGESIDEPNDEVITTNADIIAAAGQTSLVKHVGITIFYIADSLPGLFAALNYLAYLSKEWPSVQSLKIRLDYNREAYNASSVEISRFNNVIPYVVNILTLLLPGVVDLDFCGYGDNVTASLLYSQLLAAYSEQTTQLMTNYLLSFSNNHVFNKLTHLNIDLGNVKKAYQLPVILADTLVSLSLRGIPYTYNWSTFAVENESKDIEFSNLTTLKVHYAMNAGNIALFNSGMHKHQMPMLHFPKLKYFKLFNDHAVTPLLEHCVLPKELQCLQLNGSIKIISRLKMHLIKGLKRISMSVLYSDPDSHINPFTEINRVASRAQGTSNVVMLVIGALSNEMLNNISCSALTQLTICTLIGEDTIPILLQGLPNLKNLVLLKIIVDEQTCSIVAGYEKHKVNNAQPLNSSIQDLYLSFVNGNETMTTVTALVKYLLLRLPVLSVLRATQIPSLAIKEFVNEFKNYYPHLDTIKYTLSQ